MPLADSLRQHQDNRRVQALRRAVWELPSPTRRAMLTALEQDELIVGAYADRYGRICPMLAAHRRGARTGVGRFPKAWDEFARARRPRAAAPRELEILRALLQESIVTEVEQPLDAPRPTPTPAGLGR